MPLFMKRYMLVNFYFQDILNFSSKSSLTNPFNYILVDNGSMSPKKDFGILTLLPTRFLTNDYSRGGSLGPRSYFQLILTSFWTHGTIIDQFIVKGVHQ